MAEYLTRGISMGLASAHRGQINVWKVKYKYYECKEAV